jgi:hypothetical protein
VYSNGFNGQIPLIMADVAAAIGCSNGIAAKTAQSLQRLVINNIGYLSQRTQCA